MFLWCLFCTISYFLPLVNCFVNTRHLVDKSNFILMNSIENTMSKMKPATKLTMSHFKNKQGLCIRTYAAEVESPKGTAILVHGNRSHFRSDFCSYNMDWHKDFYAFDRMGSPFLAREMGAIYSKSNANKDSNDEFHFSKLDGKNVLDISPRFTLEGSFVRKLNEIGYSAYGLDLQSQGLSEGYKDYRNHFLKFDDNVHDVLQFIDLVKRGQFHNTKEEWDLEKFGKGHASGKCFLMGLSMGGNIVLRSVQLYKKLYGNLGDRVVDGVVALAPMLDIDKYFSGPLNSILTGFARIFSMCSERSTAFAHQPYFVNSLDDFCKIRDPHHIYPAKQCHKVLVSLLDATKTLRKEYKHYPKDLPTIVFQCLNDPVVDPKGAKRLVEQDLKDHKALKLVEYPENIHCITLANFNDKVFNELKTWLPSASN